MTSPAPRLLSCRRLRALLLIGLLALGLPAAAEDPGREDERLYLVTSPLTHHFRESPDHRAVWLLGLQREQADGAIAIASVFSNSFGQNCAFIAPWGRIYRNLGDVPGLYMNWTAGVIYGYTSPYQDKVPLNRAGFSPGVFPTLGYESNGWQAAVNMLGTAGVMLQINRRIR